VRKQIQLGCKTDRSLQHLFVYVKQLCTVLLFVLLGSHLT